MKKIKYKPIAITLILLSKGVSHTIGAALALLFISFNTHAGIPEALMNAVNEIEKLDTMRIGLAKTIDPKENVTKETFVRVCKPVGMHAIALSKDQPWKLKQASDKYRNPSNKPNPQELKAINAFKNDSQLTSFFWHQTEGSQKGHYYFRKIITQQQCLSCHGKKNELPIFIKNEYPQDKAHGFNAGDLRGVYSVFLGETPIAQSNESYNEK